MNEPAPSLSKIRHDLRTPLNHILGYSEMLLEDAETDGFAQVADELQTIHDSGKVLIDLINEHLGKEVESSVSREKPPELLRRCRAPINDILNRANLVFEQVANSDNQQWLADLQKIKTAAHRWLELAELFLQPAPTTRRSVSAKKSPKPE